MILHSLSLRNYRIHREFHVVFDQSRTLIGGPNECGKSTLVEAIQRSFFLKAKGATEHHRAMVSAHGGDPEIEIGFSTDGQEYRLQKRFSPKGSTVLTPIGKKALSGDEAEIELARLLRSPETIGRKELPSQWSHIWVRQGHSGSDPTMDASTQQAPLLQRLQQIGGAVAVQSNLDAQLAAQFRAERERIFRDDGNPRAGSEMASAQAHVDDSTLQKNVAVERLERLTKAINDFQSSSREQILGEQELETLAKQKREADERVIQVEALQRKEAEQIRVSNEARAKQKELKTIEERIQGFREDYQKRIAALAPQIAILEKLEAASADLRKDLNQSMLDFEAASDSVRISRQKRDFLAAVVTQFVKKDDLHQLQNRLQKVQTIQSEISNLRGEMAKFPEVDDNALDDLRKLEIKASNSAAALNAMAAELEVVVSDTPVKAGETALGPGESLILTTETEVRIGEAIQLQIRPGGGRNLDTARKEQQESREALRRMLEEIGVSSVDEATEAFIRRKELLLQIEKRESILAEAEADALPFKVAEAEESLASAEAECLRRRQTATDSDLPESHDGAKTQLGAAEFTLLADEQVETSLKAERDAKARTANDAEQNFTSQKSATEKERGALNDLNIQIRTLEETHGNTETRAEKYEQLNETVTAADKALNSTRESLTALNADHATADAARLKRALETTQSSIADAITRRAVAEASLRSDGSVDPQSELEFKTAQLNTALARLNAATRKAKAIELLDQLFTEEQRSLANRFTQPLAAKISGYLECLFGSGVRVNVIFNDNQFQGLELARTTHGGGAFDFDTLSGGTKEQVAAAVRLAIAEILAEGFDGCLPVIFDDAFAYSDPERVQTLQRMLDLAARNGLQVIVLTCNPTDYISLGAKQTLIPAGY